MDVLRPLEQRMDSPSAREGTLGHFRGHHGCTARAPAHRAERTASHTAARTTEHYTAWQWNDNPADTSGYLAPEPLVPHSSPLPRPRHTKGTPLPEIEVHPLPASHPFAFRSSSLESDNLIPYSAPLSQTKPLGRHGCTTGSPLPEVEAHPLPTSHPFALRSSSLETPENLIPHSAPLSKTKPLGHQGCAVPHSEPLPQGKPLPLLTHSQPLVHHRNAAPVALPLPSSPPSSKTSQSHVPRSEPLAQPGPQTCGHPQAHPRHATALPVPSSLAQPLSGSERVGAPGAASRGGRDKPEEGGASRLRVLDTLGPLPRGKSTGGKVTANQQSLVVLPSGRVLNLAEMWASAGDADRTQGYEQGIGCTPGAPLAPLPELFSRSAPIVPSVAAAFLPQHVLLPSPKEVGEREEEEWGEGERGDVKCTRRGMEPPRREVTEEEASSRSTSAGRGTRDDLKAQVQLAQSQIVSLQPAKSQAQGEEAACPLPHTQGTAGSGRRTFFLPPPPLAEAVTVAEPHRVLFQKLQRTRKAMAWIQ